MRRPAAFVFAALAACGGTTRKRVHHPGDEYLATIRLVGNHAIDTDELISGLAIKGARDAQRALDDYQLLQDVTRIAGEYQKRGYFAVDVHPKVERHGDALTAVFEIHEGPRANAHVVIDGLPPDIPFAKARALVELEDGAAFDYTAYDDAKAKLQLLVEDAGYAHAHLQAEVIADRTHAQATLEYLFDPGPACTFGDVELKGADGGLAAAARARIPFHRGDRYSSTKLADAQSELYGLGRFTVVRVEPDRSGDATEIPVAISVAQAQRHELRLGGGVGVDPLTFSLRLRLPQYSVAGWPDPLSTFTFDFRPAVAVQRCGLDLSSCDYEPRIRLIAGITRKDFLRRHVVGEVEGGLDYLGVEAYTSEGARVRLGLAMPLGTPKLTARIGWQLSEIGFTGIIVDAATAQRLGLHDSERIGAYSEAIVLDLRDNPIEPKRISAYAELRATEGTAFAGGAFDYLQLTPELRGFLPIGSILLAGRARVGVVSGQVPATERYYAGGASSHRGFAERQLSPSAPTAGDPTATVVIGGRGLVETGAELRAPAGTVWGARLGTVAFVDGGDVTEAYGDLDLGHLHWAVGLGLRMFALPIGPFRLDIAYRLNRRGAGEPEPDSRFSWFISVGEAY